MPTPDQTIYVTRSMNSSVESTMLRAVLEHARERGESWAPQHLRTTSARERVNRVLRQKTRQVGTVQSATGLTAALALVLAHRELGPDRLPTDLWTEVLEAGWLVG
jgi:hypothetical protein